MLTYAAAVARMDLATQPLAEIVSALLLLRELARIFERQLDKASAVQGFLEVVLQPMLAVGVAALEAPPAHAGSSLVAKVGCNTVQQQ
jgi:hypothetical protein